MQTDLYIYYRVPVSQAVQFAEKALTFQQRLAQEHDVVTALKRRPEAQDGMHTWMEIYLATDDHFAGILEQALTASDLPALIVGARHTEHFMDITACA